MRPVSLHVEGFAAFRDPVDLDFEGLDFFALVGPTGAGKSTIIDAICFALYGSVPRYGDDRVVGKAVSLGRTEARVSLTFDVGPHRYRATRVVRLRNGKATTPEAILEQIDTNGPSDVLADRASQMRAAVEHLLGLPFGHFTKSVVLPQNEFARFLQDKPADRQDLLARLLDLQVYARVGQRARRLADQISNEVELQQRQLAELAFATPEAQAEAEARRDALRELLRAVDEAAPADEAHAEAIRAADSERAEAEALTAAVAAIAVPAAVVEAAAGIEQARAALAAASTAASTAEQRARELAEHVEALPDVSVLRAARQAHEQRDTLTSELAAIDAAVDASADALRRADEVVERADVALADARAALEHLRDAHAAHALFATLEVGAPCPVCEQVVERKPRAKKPAAVARSEQALAGAEQRAEQARVVERTATREHERSVAERDAVGTRIAEIEIVISSHPDPAALDAALAETARTTAAATAARTADATARRAEEQARAALTAAERVLREFQTEFHAQRDRVASLEPPPVGDDLAGSWAALAEWAAGKEIALTARVHELARTATVAREARSASVAALAALAEQRGVAVATNELARLRETVVEAGIDARHGLEHMADALERAEKLRAGMTGLAHDYEVARLLAQHLRADHFEKWLVGEALDRLVAGASVTLYQLTGGDYSLAYDDGGDFVVIDHRNADEARSVRTLSGGETFQASLALALALADQLSDMAASGGAKLDAIFLDEGFGTLDAETLDSVAGTIETLGSAGRMVGVVTHVPALAERVPVRFRVRPGTRGATVVREEL
jgi:exonuclease SbcC